jgi:hypothetical protein
MKEYNKESHDEYDTLHFAGDIVVDDKNLPKVFTPLNNWRDFEESLQGSHSNIRPDPTRLHAVVWTQQQ